MFRMRPARLFFAVALIASAAIPSDATAAPRLPSSEAEWIAMTSEQQSAVMDYIWERFERDLAEGKVEIQEVRDDGTANATASIQLAAVSVSRNCVVQWTSYAGGDYVRGGGWTDASTNVGQIVAGLRTQSPYSSGQLLRDGAHQGYWGQSALNASHAESYTGWVWTWAWETSNWVTKGWHTARTGSTYYLGPDNYCTASKLL